MLYVGQCRCPISSRCRQKFERDLLLSVFPDYGNITRRPYHSHCRGDTGSDELKINGIMLMVAANAFGIWTNQWEAICMPYDHTSVLIPNCLQAMTCVSGFTSISSAHDAFIKRSIDIYLQRFPKRWAPPLVQHFHLTFSAAFSELMPTHIWLSSGFRIRCLTSLLTHDPCRQFCTVVPLIVVIWGQHPEISRYDGLCQQNGCTELTRFDGPNILPCWSAVLFQKTTIAAAEAVAAATPCWPIL